MSTTTLPLPPVPGDLVAPTARLVLPSGDLNSSAYRTEWEAVRRLGIGGSDVAAIVGLDKYRGQRHVFEEKHGREVVRDNEAMEIGREIEDFIARLFSKRTGVPIATPPGTIGHVDHPWALVNIDRDTLDPDTGEVVGPLECKNRSEYQLEEWESEDGPPDAPALQCHWGMAVGGYQRGYVAALVGGNKLRWHVVERDQEMVEHLLDYCGTWYQRHVVEGFPPPVDGLETTKDLLGRLWEVKPEAIAEVDLRKAKDLRSRKASLDAQIKDLAYQKTTVENEMRDLAGNADIVRVGAATAWTWKANGNFSETDFRAQYPDLAAKYTTTVEVLDLARLKKEQEAAYSACRGRRLYVPKKEL
ncbi:YqaJ viral recombinase family protein [Streptomyces sp. CCM_MD2014]|uniref:YqaJ viral recombinase family nuclease n=1 Tax=Streptomyces sp. CCM_MD2014 TaxID=1561022 RepID=UPI00052A7A2A|nr:YqaJ viral recombinase family protein [Streptomyces sp. CCM_MD2014]AIV35550.1 phage-type endonuclease [Streptomyces sp. CCM_MD2014]